MIELHNPHNAFFNATFEDPRLAGIYFHENLPNRIAQHLDYSQPEKIDGSFIDEDLTGSQCDALFRVRTKTGKPVYMYVLLEHKSTHLRIPACRFSWLHFARRASGSGT